MGVHFLEVLLFRPDPSSWSDVAHVSQYLVVFPCFPVQFSRTESVIVAKLEYWKWKPEITLVGKNFREKWRCRWTVVARLSTRQTDYELFWGVYEMGERNGAHFQMFWSFDTKRFRNLWRNELTVAEHNRYERIICIITKTESWHFQQTETKPLRDLIWDILSQKSGFLIKPDLIPLQNLNILFSDHVLGKSKRDRK